MRLVQAPVAPLDADGVQSARVGTLLWALAALVTWWADASWWWLATCATGVLIGLAMMVYCTRRRARNRALQA